MSEQEKKEPCMQEEAGKKDAEKAPEQAEPEQKKEQGSEAEKPKHEEKHAKPEEKQDPLAKKLKEREEEIEKLKAEEDKLKEENRHLKTEYLKAYADTENMQKRLQRDFEQQDRYKMQSFAKAVLPVLDNCERALAVKSEDENYRKAFEMVLKNLTKALKEEGVEEIECLNQPFDPNWHQAMMTEHAEGVKPGTVTQVLQKGYKLKDRLLRAAMVKVSE